MSRLVACANRTGQALLIFAALISLLGLLVALIEGWPLGDGLWWAFTTGTTTGYGDLAPASALGRVLGVLTMFAGIIGIGVIVGRIAASVIETRDAWKHEEQEQVKDELADIRRGVEALLARASTTVHNVTVGTDPDRSRVLGALHGAAARVTGRRTTSPAPSSGTASGTSTTRIVSGGSPASYDPTPNLLLGMAVGAALSDDDCDHDTASPDTASPDSGSSDSSGGYDGGGSYDSGSSASYDSGSSSSYDSGSSASYDSGSSSSGGDFGGSF